MIAKMLFRYGARDICARCREPIEDKPYLMVENPRPSKYYHTECGSIEGINAIALIETVPTVFRSLAWAELVYGLDIPDYQRKENVREYCLVEMNPQRLRDGKQPLTEIEMESVYQQVHAKIVKDREEWPEIQAMCADIKRERRLDSRTF